MPEPTREPFIMLCPYCKKHPGLYLTHAAMGPSAWCLSCVCGQSESVRVTHKTMLPIAETWLKHRAALKWNMQFGVDFT